MFQVAIAKQHFNCSSLTGVPLMGENPLGDGSRGSHWETRLVADDIMAYGNGGMVSSLTLAIMEDTGFYLAQHENAGCLAWGRAQGCSFVSSRCGVRRDDLTAHMPPELCAREHPTDSRCTAWEQHEEGGEMQRLCWPPDAFLTTKCAAPDCAREWRSGRCNAECVVGQTTTTPTAGANNSNASAASRCGLALPDGAVGISRDGLDISAHLVSGMDTAVSAVTEWVGGSLLMLLVVAVLSMCSCCEERCKHSTVRALSMALNAVFALTATAAALTCVYALNTHDYESLVSAEAARLALFASVGTAALSMIGCCGAKRRSSLALALFMLLLFLVILAQLVMVIAIVWFINASHDADESTYEILGAKETSTEWTGDASVDTVVDQTFAELEGFGCQLYKTCCARGPALEALNGSCTAAHNGATVGAAAMLAHDPSSPQFCRLLSGSEVAARAPPAFATCLALEDGGAVNLGECSADFCPAGISGFSSFMESVIAWLREEAWVLAAGFGVLMLLEIVSLVMSCVTCRRAKGSDDDHGQGERSDLLRAADSAAGRELSDLGEQIDIRTASVHGGPEPEPEPGQAPNHHERKRFRAKIQATLAAAERRP